MLTESQILIKTTLGIAFVGGGIFLTYSLYKHSDKFTTPRNRPLMWGLLGMFLTLIIYGSFMLFTNMGIK